MTKRAFSINDLYTKKRKLFKLPTGLHELIGEAELTGSWIVWGDSGMGKTSFTCQLAKALCTVDKVIYNSLEEGDSQTLKKAFKRVKMEEVRGKLFPCQMDIGEIREWLKRQRSPRIVIVDSAQYTGLSVPEYKKLVKEFKNVLWIWIAHEEGKKPEGTLAKKIRFDAHVKIRVVGFKAWAISRYQDKPQPYVISETKADEYWGAGLIEGKKMI